MVRWRMGVAAGLVLGGAMVAAAQTMSDAARLDRFYADEWQYQLEHAPEFATYAGDFRFDDRLDDGSVAAIAESARHAGEALQRLRAMPARGLSENETISREIMLRQLQDAVDSYRLKEWVMPVNQMSGIHLDLAALHEATPFRNAKDYREYIARLHQVPRAMDQAMTVMRLGMRDHLMEPRFLLEKVPAQARSIGEAAPEKSPFAVPLEQFPAGVSEADRAAIRREMLGAIEHDVHPAYLRFAAFVETTYAPAGRMEPGIWSLPNGEALYRQAIHEHVQTTMDAEAIHREGMREVDAIEAEMLALAKSQGYADVKSYNAHLATDPAVHGVSGEQILKMYAGYEAQSRAKLNTVVLTVPTLPLEVVPMDAFRAPNAVPADYSPGSAKAGRPGRVNVNEYAPTTRSLLNVEAIAYHEGLPGHHLQFSEADQLAGLPNFRRFASFDAYSEGWALYAELLGKEMGFYREPWSEYGRLQNEMWRAIRLVVDTGVHSKHWTRQQMVDFFKQHTAMDDGNIQNEVDRYIAWPGQALSYRLGQQKILELRSRAQTELGDRFDVRAFHERVLSLGPVPLDVLDESVTRWIAETKAGPAK